MMHLFSREQAEIHADAVVPMAAAEKVEDIVPAAARRFSGPARRSHAFFNVSVLRKQE